MSDEPAENGASKTVDDLVEGAEPAKVKKDKKKTIDAGKLGFGTKKKKKTKKGDEDGAGGSTPWDVDGVIIDGTGQPFVFGEIYSYEELLDRIQELIIAHNPDLQGSKRYAIKPPQVSRVGSRRVAWTNFRELTNAMNRSQDHVYQFVLAELGTEGSISADGQLILKGRYGVKHIENLLRRYITEYVRCSMCSSPQTALNKDPRTRLYTISCSACGADRSVTTIRSGFHAVSRADRRKAKQAK